MEILVGKDKGKHGIISQVIQERNWVIVEGLNAHIRRVGRTADYPGAIVISEAPLLVTTDISIVDPSDLQKTEFEWRFTEEGDRVRVSLRTGRIIPLPTAHYETADFKTKSAYIERDKDTKGKVVTEITFKPTLQTFEMDIMNQMGIVEDRIPTKTIWY